MPRPRIRRFEERYEIAQESHVVLTAMRRGLYNTDVGSSLEEITKKVSGAAQATAAKTGVLVPTVSSASARSRADADRGYAELQRLLRDLRRVRDPGRAQALVARSIELEHELRTTVLQTLSKSFHESAERNGYPNTVTGERPVPKHSLFVAGAGDTRSIHPNDVAQGQLGNCYLLAALGALAHARPSLIRDMFVGEHSVVFRGIRAEPFPTDDAYPTSDPTEDGDAAFARFGDPKRLRIPQGKPGYRRPRTVVRGRETWVMKIEQAWRWAVTTTSFTQGWVGDEHADKRGFRRIEGGYGYIVYAAIHPTGAEALYEHPRGLPTSIKNSILEASRRRWPMTMGTRPPEGDAALALRRAKLVPSHAYFLHDADERGVLLKNPWGVEHPPRLSYDDLEAAFAFASRLRL